MTRSIYLPSLCALLLGTTLFSWAGAQSNPPGNAESFVIVQAGDTTYSLARRAGLSVADLLTLNGLSSPDLQVGQVLRLRHQVIHTVQAGETPYGIARQYGVPLDALLLENTLTRESKLSIGQNLKIPEFAPPSTTRAATPTPIPNAPSSPDAKAPPTATRPGVAGSPFQPGTPPSPALHLTPPQTLPVIPATPPSPPENTVPADWLSNALALLGTPYVYGGTSRSGTDCSGFILQVFGPLGLTLPRTSAAQSQVGRNVAPGEWQPGDLLFFDTEGRGAVTHVGIYLGNDEFVNANSYAGKVQIDRLLADHYWAPRYLSARRILQDLYAQP